jgi:hypothetical protein
LCRQSKILKEKRSRRARARRGETCARNARPDRYTRVAGDRAGGTTSSNKAEEEGTESTPFFVPADKCQKTNFIFYWAHIRQMSEIGHISDNCRKLNTYQTNVRNQTIVRATKLRSERHKRARIQSTYQMARSEL